MVNYNILSLNNLTMTLVKIDLNQASSLSELNTFTVFPEMENPDNKNRMDTENDETDTGEEMFFDVLDEIFEENPMDLVDQALANTSGEATKTVSFESEEDATEKFKIAEKSTGKRNIKKPVALIDQALVTGSTSGGTTELNKTLEVGKDASEEKKGMIGEKETIKRKIKKQKIYDKKVGRRKSKRLQAQVKNDKPETAPEKKRNMKDPASKKSKESGKNVSRRNTKKK